MIAKPTTMFLPRDAYDRPHLLLLDRQEEGQNISNNNNTTLSCFGSTSSTTSTTRRRRSPISFALWWGCCFWRRCVGIVVGILVLTTTRTPVVVGQSSSSSSTIPTELDTILYYGGSNDCPCMESELSSLINCRRPDDDDGTITCYPEEYGSTYCLQHDRTVDPACQTPDGSNTTTFTATTVPQYCFDYWCYVDYDKCLLSQHMMYQSIYKGASDLYYSYSTCSSSNGSRPQTSASSSTTNNTSKSTNTYNRFERQRKSLEALHSAGTVTVVIPEIWYPMHYKYKRNENDVLAESGGEEYYDDTVPWQGWVIDYINDLAQHIHDHSNDDIAFTGFHFTYRSKGGDTLVNATSAWSAAVQDVANGIRDMAASTFWITSERLQVTSFSTPIISDKIYLWVHPPDINNGIQDNFLKVVQPFTIELWFCFIGSVVLASILSIWFSNEYGSHRKWWRTFHNDKWETSTPTQRCIIVLQVLYDAVIEDSTYFFGQTVNYDMYASYPKKIVTVGYAFLVLIAVAAYTANLAAYLTRLQVEYIHDMKEAILRGITICAPLALQQDLEITWPTAHFLYEDLELEMIHHYQRGNCSAIASSTIDLRGNPSVLQEWCTIDLFNTGSLVLEKPIGFPVSSTMVGGISHYLLETEKDGIEFANYTTNRDQPCSLDVSSYSLGSESEQELGRLTPEHFILPFTVLMGSAILAIIVHCIGMYHKWSKRRMKQPETTAMSTATSTTFNQRTGKEESKQIDTIPEEFTNRDANDHGIVDDHGSSQECVEVATDDDREFVKRLAAPTSPTHQTLHGEEQESCLPAEGDGLRDEGKDGEAMDHEGVRRATSLPPPAMTSSPPPPTHVRKHVSMFRWPSLAPTSSQNTTTMRRRRRSSAAASGGTAGSTRRRKTSSIHELTTILQDSESAGDSQSKVRALKYIAMYQNQICSSSLDHDVEDEDY